MSSFAAERYEYAEYFSGSGAITCLVFRRTAELCFVRFRTADWGEGNDGFSIYVTAAIFPENLRPVRLAPEARNGRQRRQCLFDSRQSLTRTNQSPLGRDAEGCPGGG